MIWIIKNKLIYKNETNFMIRLEKIKIPLKIYWNFIIINWQSLNKKN